MRLLAKPEAVGCVTEAALGADGEEMAQDARVLLSAALDEARMALENDVPEASA
ncbi:MAG: hypothetical protein ACEPO2_07100 [Pelagibaca sp.]